MDFYEQIATINNWNISLKLSAFSLYLRGVASTWYLNLSPDIREDFERLKNAFHERFTADPNEWILLQQLDARKQLPNEPLDSYVCITTVVPPGKRIGVLVGTPYDTIPNSIFVHIFQSTMM